MYNEKSKIRQMRYQAEKRDKLTLNLPLGVKAEWKEIAAEKGYSSITAMITELIEKEKPLRE